MSKGAPDYTKIVSLKGRDAQGNDVSVLVDSTGRILAVLQGAVEVSGAVNANITNTVPVTGSVNAAVTGTVNAVPTTTVRQVQGSTGTGYLDLAVDSTGRMIALIKGSYEGIATTVSLDEDGNLNARLKGRYGPGLLDVAVDQMGRMVIIDVTNQKQTSRIRAAIDTSPSAAEIATIPAFTNFYGYVETDPGGALAVIEKKVSTGNVQGGTTSHVRKDKGAADVGDFNIEFDFYYNNVNGGNYVYLSVSDTNSDNSGFVGANGGQVHMIEGTNSIYLGKIVNSALTESAAITLINLTQFWGRFQRVGAVYTLYIYSNSARTTQVAGSPVTLTGASTALRYVSLYYTVGGGGYANGYIEYTAANFFPFIHLNDLVLSGTNYILATAATSGAGISYALVSTAALNKYWQKISMNLAKNSSTHASPFQAKFYGSADSYAAALNANWFTIPEAEYASLLLERPVVKTATSNGQTVWTFTSLTGGDALINEIGVQYLLLLELAVDGTNYVPLYLASDYTYNDTNRKVPVITLLSGTGIVSGTSKLRATMVVDVIGIDGATTNTSIKVQIQENRTASGEASPAIDVLAWDATKYLEAYYVSGYW